MSRRDGFEACVLRLFALTIMIQVHPIPGAVNEIIGREAGLIQELVSLAKSEESNGVSDVRL